MRVGFGGGCHWCTEAVFQSLHGVSRVEQGYIRSMPPDDAWSEAVIVHFEPETTRLETLIDAHLHTHSATKRHALRERYRSAVYVFGPAQKRAACEAITALQAAFSDRLITRVLPFAAFRPSDERNQNYFRKHPEAPFSQRYIQPKLERLQSRFAVQAPRR